MASIHRRPHSPFYHAAWRDSNGRLHLQSTKQIARDKALAVAMEFQRAQRLGDAGNLTEAQCREVLSGILERTGGDGLRHYSIEEWFRDWLRTKEDRTAAGTHVRYAQVVDAFLDHLGGDRAKRPLTSLEPRDVQGFMGARTKAGLSAATVSLDCQILTGALNRARKLGLVTTNAAEAVERPKGEPIERGTFTAAEVQMLVNAAEGEWKTVILLAYFTGARLTDACNMVWTGPRSKDKLREGVDLVRATITYWQTKTQKLVLLPLHADLMSHLEQLASADKPEQFLTPKLAKLTPGGRNGLSEQFKAIVRQAGLSLDIVQGGGTRQLSKRSFHSLRHSFASALANAGVAPELRMKLTGHKSAAVHAGYSHHEVDVLRTSAISKLPSLNGK
jgi:integrase